ncbi:MAG: fimbrial protein FimV, partial [Ramlibacter sp.]|nr:fimbrial protein FimV [Ramlibacter sp.]
MKLPLERAVGAPQPMSKPQGRLSALALAAALAFGFATTDAQALALGRITVQSALGEPLRVQIDVPDINPDEVASLRVNVAAPDAFRAAGVEYNTALSSATITLQRRPDGRYFLQLTSDRAINDPFVDLILETTWGSGRIVRDYTMLFDPPNLRQPQAPIAAQVAPAPAQQQRTQPAQPSAQAPRPA